MLLLLCGAALAQDTPLEDPTVEAAERPTPSGPRVGVAVPMGELRFDAYGDELGGLGDGDGSLAFQVSRAGVGTRARLADNATAVIVIDVRQNGAGVASPVLGGEGNVSVDKYPDDWQVTLPFAYVTASGTVGGRVEHTVTAGVQKTLFGIRDHYDLENGWFVPHPQAYRDLGRRSKVIEPFDLGVLWTGALGPVALDLQVTNGGGWRTLDADLGKQGVARLRVAPVEAVAVVGTVLYQVEGSSSETTTVAWQAGGELHLGPARVLVEGLGGKTYQPDARRGFLGVAAAAVLELDLPPAVLDLVRPVVALQRWDPDTGVVDGGAWTALQGGAVLFWQAERPLRTWTGIGWETLFAEDPDHPVSHSLALQLGAKR